VVTTARGSVAVTPYVKTAIGPDDVDPVTRKRTESPRVTVVSFGAIAIDVRTGAVGGGTGDVSCGAGGDGFPGATAVTEPDDSSTTVESLRY
jgi:hypothetical protein